MIGNQEVCDAFTSMQEGGFTDNRDDPGNWTGGAVGSGILKGTNHGIAASTHPGVDIAKLTPYQASLLRLPYWQQVNGAGLPLGVDLMEYDFAVNAGSKRSALVLESVLGAIQDGSVGPTDTRLAGAMDPGALIDLLAAAQEAFYRSLPTFAKFGTGWTRRTEARRLAAHAMLAECHAAHVAAAAAQPAPPTPAAPAGTAVAQPGRSILKAAEGYFSRL